MTLLQLTLCFLIILLLSHLTFVHIDIIEVQGS